MTTTRRWAYIQETTGAQVLEKEDVYKGPFVCGSKEAADGFRIYLLSTCPLLARQAAAPPIYQ